jgi:hypothetical protein
MTNNRRSAPRRGKTRRRGVAILLVLAVVALMTVLLVGVVFQSTTHRTATRGELEQNRVRLVADTAVHIALAQLREATERRGSDGGPAAWTSQPGAARVHRMDGSLDRLYKLYTSDKMMVRSAADTAHDVPRDWAQHPESYVDLNAPLVTDHGEGGGVTLQFPIVDPRAKSDHPRRSVEGFDYSLRDAPQGTVGAGGDPDRQRLPMPVRWLYQLKDGSFGVVDGTGVWRGLQGGVPTRENPMVARFAFWTDDESCKINVNTAAEGVHWDSPRADTAQERALAERQPLSTEFHRQPGHPAGVCLSSVLAPGERFHAPHMESAPRAGGDRLREMSFRDVHALWRLGRLECAEYGEGTSQGGTMTPEIDVSGLDQPAAPVKTQVRYSSVAEMLWEQRPGRGRGARISQEYFRRHPDAAERVRRGEFFLTTASAAPETTLFGTPRIALWPVHGSTDLQASAGHAPVERATAYDYQVALAATLAGRKYYVQRLRPADGNWDLEKANSGENRVLLEYLRALTSRAIPGWHRPQQGGGTFADKYGPDRESLLLGMLDYVRAANFADGQLPKENQFPIPCPGNPEEGFGQIGPMTQGGKTKGAGRMLTVSEVALMFVCRAEVAEDGTLRGEPSGPNREKLKQPGDREIEAALLVEAFVPSHGWADYRPYASFSLTGGPAHSEPDAAAEWPAMQLNGAEFLPLQSKATARSSPEPPQYWTAWGGAAGVRATTERVIAFRPVVISNCHEAETRLTFSGSLNHAGLQLKLAVYDDPGSAASGRAGRGDLMQVLPLEIPPLGGAVPGDLPIPSLPGGDLPVTIEKRLRAARQGKPLFSSGDVVQSLVPVHGDYRLLAAQSRAEAPEESTHASAQRAVFVTHPLWGRARFAHSLSESNAAARERVLGQGPADGDAGNPEGLGYFAGLRLSPAYTPDVPVRAHDAEQTVWASADDEAVSVVAAEATNWRRLDDQRRGPARPDITGDFDNGLGNSADGPYTNRPDDGDLRPLASGGMPYFSTQSATGMAVPPVSPDVFSPQRLFPSAVMLGSLPTGVASQVPWQTLLFRPQPEHYGAKTPPDHLLLDLFWTPVLLPEPLSHHLETEGKINVNHPLVPFSYIRRETALHAAMKAETMMAIPDEAAQTYKSGARPGDEFRHFIDAGATLAEWQRAVFREGRVFLTPGEICEHPLIPEGSGATTATDMADYWRRHRLTGDNSRERPYAHLYARLTTRSNAFRVHFVAETIRKADSTPPHILDLSEDAVTARQRGSCLIRRTLDTTAPQLPDYTDTTRSHPPLDAFYEWHISAWRDLR